MSDYAYNFDTCARVLEEAEPITYNGSWEVIKDELIDLGEIAELAGVVQKVVSIQKAATETATTGETLSTLCAMDVAETKVAGGVVTTLTPKAAIAFTPKTVALCAIAGTVGLNFGFRIGQNLVNLYYGDDWDWDAPGIFDAAKGLIRTYIKADGTTYYDKETIDAITNRLNEIDAFSDGSVTPITPTLDNWVKYNTASFSAFKSYVLGYANTMVYDPELPVSVDKLIKLINAAFTGFESRHGTPPENSLFFCAVIPEVGELNLTVYSSDTVKTLNVKTYDESQINNGAFIRTSGIIFDAYTGDDSGSNISTKYIVVSMSMENSEPVYSEQTWEDNRIVSFNAYGVEGYYEFNNLLEITESGIPGVEKQPEATVPTNFPLEIPEVYPDWIAETLTNPDSNANIYPVKMPNTNPDADAATNPQSEAQKGLNPDPDADKSIKDAIDNSPQAVEGIGLNPNPPSPTEDIGKLPIPIVPTTGIQGTGFVAIYNPTQSQLAAFSQYMWSKNFIDNISKLFEDPMQAIIGLHMIYATPSRGADSNIVCGYLDSGVTSRTVSSQYINMACGAIKINRYFGNILDYAPYTKVQLFLPFIGIVNLDTNEVMNSILNVTYRVDVLTGACLAQISVSRSDYGAVMYTFSGNCAVQLPISGGNYSSIIANTIGIGASIGATLASGGALAPVLVAGAATAVSNSHLSVAHSGSIGANAGALGGKIPYLIITRPKPYNANNYNNYYGYPSNLAIKLSSCSGYTRVKDIHLEHISRATDDELNEIESLLKTGVII